MFRRLAFSMAKLLCLASASNAMLITCQMFWFHGQSANLSPILCEDNRLDCKY